MAICGYPRSFGDTGLTRNVILCGGGGISEITSDSDLSLEILADKFGYAPQVLSRKISACIDVDLRVFINDVRAQKVMMMRNDERYKDLSLMEIASRCGFNSVATFYRSYNRNFKNSEQK